MNIMTFEELNDKDLVEFRDDTIRNMAFYHAAEGQQWYLESVDREHCRTRLNNIRAEIEKRGLKVHTLEIVS